MDASSVRPAKPGRRYSPDEGIRGSTSPRHYMDGRH